MAEMENLPAPPLAEMLAMYERWSKELIEVVSKVDDEGWDRKAQGIYQGKVVMEQPLGIFLWFILFDSIHHRGTAGGILAADGRPGSRSTGRRQMRNRRRNPNGKSSARPL